MLRIDIGQLLNCSERLYNQSDRQSARSYLLDFMAAGTGTKGRTGPAARRCNFIREALAIAALITAVPAFAETASPEPALEATPPIESGLSEVEAVRARAAYSEAVAAAI